MKRRIQLRIPTLFAGVTLLEFLIRRFPYHDAAGWQERLAQRRVQVGDHPADGAQVLALGDLVEYLADDLPEPRVNLDVTVLFEDADLLVINKPPNLPCHPSGRYFHHTLWAVLKTRFGMEQPLLVNRLDRETSGLTIVAKTAEAGKLLSAEFSARRVEKQYLVLVEGAFPPCVEARGLLLPDADSPVRKKLKFVAAEAAPPELASKWAETVFRNVETLSSAVTAPGLPADPVSLVEATPVTGRLHQLRATLQSLGFPVVGDKLYGHDPALFIRFCQDQLSDGDRAVLRLDRQALHASQLRIRHPRTQQMLDLEAPLPADMAALLAELRKR
jgi:23S rRNA pseudouridine955/2504/2580 synthase/23S rRNA pseudouridine1911/1915/1917 synthase